MVAVLAEGGLGNMLFQIAFGINQSRKYNTEYKVLNYDNNSNHINYLHNTQAEKYRNTIFKNINFDDYIPQNLHIYHHKITLFKYHEIEYIQNMLNIYQGYFQSEKFFKQSEQTIKEIFSPDCQQINYILSKYPQLRGRSISVHIRRGDYLYKKEYHPVIPKSYYEKSISLFDPQNVFVFSDDLDWCKKNLSKKYIFVDEPDWICLYMMSLCQNHIIANSSFSWWGAKMASWSFNHVNVINPKTWFGEAYNHDLSDLFPSHWITQGV
jgi:hypothetical protein